MKNAAERVAFLRDELARHNRLYYVEATPEITDRVFDALLRELEGLEAEHPELADADSPTGRVGGEPIAGFVKVKHSVPMLSIDNTYSADELREWDARVRRDLGEDSTAKVRYVLEPKVDGVAVSLRYEGGKLVVAATRGDGTTGDDVTHNARGVRSIPVALAGQPPGVLEVRGEIYMPADAFGRLNRDQQTAADEKGREATLFANPRNATAGTLKQLDPKVAAGRGLRFVAHGLGVVAGLGVTRYHETLERLRAMGIPTSPHTLTADDAEEALAHIEHFGEKIRGTLPFQTDGMVVKVDDLAQRERLGYRSKSPRWVIAYKFPAEQAQTTLNAVTWQVGKNGGITPVAELEPVFVAGTTVRRATLHNRDQVRKLGVRTGDLVTVEKAGEIIPQVVAVAERRGESELDVPTRCPECASPLEAEALKAGYVGFRCGNADCPDFDVRRQRKKPPEECPTCGAASLETLAEGIDLLCVNEECPKKAVERLKWFCGRGQMDVDRLGVKLIEALHEAAKLRTFADIYRLSKDDLVALERMGEKAAENVLAGIEASRGRPLFRLIAGLGVRHVGQTASRLFAERFKTVDALLAASVADLAEAEGVGPVIAESFYNYLNGPGGDVLRDLQSVGVNPASDAAPVAAAGGPLAGKTVVVTGTFAAFKREEIEQRVRDLGAKVASAVSKNTDLLLAGDKAGSKLKKAKDLGVEVMDEAAFLSRYG